MAKGIVTEISRRLSGAEHASVTDSLLDRIVGAGQERTLKLLDSEALFELSRATRSVGLFTGSAPLEEAAIAAMKRQASRLPASRQHVSLIRAAIADGDLGLAVHSARQIERIRLLDRLEEARNLLVYVALWSRDFETAERYRPISRDSGNRTCAYRQKVLVYGPGPTDTTLPFSVSDWQVGRVLMPGVTYWPGSEDLAAGKADIVYSNGMTDSWLLSMSSVEAELVVRFFDTIVCKGSSSADEIRKHTGSNAVAAVMPPIFASGQPNMAQIMLWDLINALVDSLYVTGVSFFLGSTPYRSDSLRYRPESNTTQDPLGGTGHLFERCSGISSHNPTINRRFVINLLSSGLLWGDSHFTSAVSMTDGEYCAELDCLYGVPRS